MASTERVTVTLPNEMLEGIDRIERNRSRFIAEAVAHELARRRREGLLHSLSNPHSESGALADAGLAEWGNSLPSGDDDLLDPKHGKAVRWIEGQGWTQEP